MTELLAGLVGLGLGCLVGRAMRGQPTPPIVPDTPAPSAMASPSVPSGPSTPSGPPGPPAAVPVKADASLGDPRRFQDALFIHLADGLLVVDEAGIILAANPAAEALLGASAMALVGAPFGHPVVPGDPVEIVLPGSGEGETVVEMRSAPIPWEGAGARVVSLRDSTVRGRREQALRKSEARYRIVADYTHDWETWFGPEGDVRYVSPSCQRITGYPPSRFLEDPLFIQSLLDEDDLPAWREFMQASAVSQQQGLSLDFRIRAASGQVVWCAQVNHRVLGERDGQDESGDFLGLRASIRDITQRKEMEQELRRQALMDPLTGLANRTLLLDRLDQALMRAGRRSDYFFALCFLDLDRFKIINDSLGHAIGDKVLMEMSRRIQDSVRTLDTVSRFGGDEFVILLEELGSPRGAVQIIKRIRENVGRLVTIDGHEMRTTASMGVVLSPVDGQTPEMLLRNANIALHAAKEQGRDRFKIFTSKMLDQAVMLMTLEQDMRRGLAADEFFLVFQPFVKMETGKLVGFEALVRWKHPTRGLLPPNEFIALAEETGAIVDLGSEILEKACATWVRWSREIPGAADLLMSVNISGRQFSQFGFLDVIRAVLERTGMPPERLKLEITETTIMEDPETSAEKLNRIKDLGITLSIDDFGTGYSSMSYLQRFPLDNLKIDLSFIRLMHVSQENMEIVKAIINLAHTLNMEVVAEGVETEAQRQSLQDLSCEFGQGWHFGKPMGEKEAREFMGGKFDS